MKVARHLGVAASLSITLTACDKPAPDELTASQLPGKQTPQSNAASQTAPADDAPAPMPQLLTQAYQLAGQGQFQAARDLAAHVATTHPDEGRAPFLIAMTYHQVGNHAPALEHFERAASLSPDDPTTRHYYAECLFLLGDIDGAEREYQAWRDLQPTEPVAIYSLGLIDLEEGRLEEAAAKFTQAIAEFEQIHQADPRLYARRSAGRARCHARLADVHLAHGDYEAARDELIASTTIEPRNISAFFALSQVHRRLGEDDLADAALERYDAARRAIIEQQRRSGG